MDLFAVPVVISIALTALVAGLAFGRNRRYPSRHTVKMGDVGRMWKKQLQSRRLFHHPHLKV